MGKQQEMLDEELLGPSEDEAPDISKAEIKQGVVRVKKFQMTHLRVVGFRGDYGPIHFNDQGISTTPVDEDTWIKLHNQFPKATIEEVEAPEGKA